MFLLTLKDHKDDGAYAVADDFGEKVLFLRVRRYIYSTSQACL